MTEIYLSDITRYDGRIEKLVEGIPEEILSHCRKHQNETDLQASLLGWNILLMLLDRQKVDIEKLKLTYNEYGKPFLGTHYFSISHSGTIVAVCLSTSEVGIDLEIIRKDRDYDALSKRYFSEKEQNSYSSSEDKPTAFTKIWTKKEAFHKHIGDGIIMPTFQKDLPYQEIETTYLTDKDGNGYCLAVDCIDNEKFHIRVI